MLNCATRCFLSLLFTWSISLGSCGKQLLECCKHSSQLGDKLIPLTDLHPELPEKEAGWGHWCCLWFCACWACVGAALCSQLCTCVCAIWVFVCAHTGNTLSLTTDRTSEPGAAAASLLPSYHKRQQKTSLSLFHLGSFKQQLQQCSGKQLFWLFLMGFIEGHWGKHSPGRALGEPLTGCDLLWREGSHCHCTSVLLCVSMSIVSQNLTVIHLNSSPFEHFVHQFTTYKSFKCCKISWSLWCLEYHICQSLHPAFQKNKYDPLLAKQKIHCLFSYCLGFDWYQNKFLAKVEISPAKKSWCWAAMSAQRFSSLGKCLQRKRSLVHSQGEPLVSVS